MLAFLLTGEQADLRGCALGEHLAELAQLEERDRGVARKVLLRLRRERDEPRVVMREVSEVGGGLGRHGVTLRRGPARGGDLKSAPPAKSTSRKPPKRAEFCVPKNVQRVSGAS